MYSGKSYLKQKFFTWMASRIMVDFGDHTYIKKDYFAGQY